MPLVPPAAREHDAYFDIYASLAELNYYRQALDATQMQRTLVNVLENALRYSDAGSPVRLTGAEIGSDVVLRVTDQGPGIEAAELERIFEPFHRGAAASGRSGSGLGLAIARGFAEENGGSLSADATEGGATLVVLPGRDHFEGLASLRCAMPHYAAGVRSARAGRARRRAAP